MELPGMDFPPTHTHTAVPVVTSEELGATAREFPSLQKKPKCFWRCLGGVLGTLRGTGESGVHGGHWEHWGVLGGTGESEGHWERWGDWGALRGNGGTEEHWGAVRGTGSTGESGVQ